jgi:uncharacterized protein
MPAAMLWETSVMSLQGHANIPLELRGDRTDANYGRSRTMAWLNTTTTGRDIADVVAQIVERFHPQQVVLFGSHAYGIPTPDSDVDLLVVMETSLRHIEQAVEIRKAVDFPFPVDILVRTPQHIAERIALGDVFLREVLTKGVVLYAANDTGIGR